MQDLSRYVSLSYLVGGLVTAGILVKIVALLFGSFAPASDLIVFAGIRLSTVLGLLGGLAVTVWAVKSDRVSQIINETVSELAQVTWPNREETQSSTVVVIIFSILISLVLASFDFVWKYATDIILSA
jgi:preprotein translocase SecE subunit